MRASSGCCIPRTYPICGAVIAASIVGFLGNEAVAIFRIRVGQEINSAALIADGYHARVDGWTSLAVLFGAVGVWLGYPLADPIIGLLITAAIFGIVIQSGKSIFIRMLDGAEPDVIDEIRHAAEHVPQVKEVTEVRARWLGHRLHAELNIAVDPRTDDRAGACDRRRGSPPAASSSGLFVARRHPRRSGGSVGRGAPSHWQNMPTTGCRSIRIADGVRCQTACYRQQCRGAALVHELGLTRHWLACVTAQKRGPLRPPRWKVMKRSIGTRFRD